MDIYKIIIQSDRIKEYENGFISIGWKSAGDLREYSGDIRNIAKERINKDEVRNGAGPSSLFYFFYMKEGDQVILVKQGDSSRLAVLEIIGKYYFFEHEEYPHRRTVRKLDDIDPDILWRKYKGNYGHHPVVRLMKKNEQ